MHKKSEMFYFHRMLTGIFCVILSIPLFSFQGIPFAHAQAENIGYEFGNLPIEAHDSMIQAIQSRPSNILNSGTYFIVGQYYSEENWGIGYLATALGNEPPNWESSIAFIVHSDVTWQVALQGTSPFNNLIVNLPIALEKEINVNSENDVMSQITSTTFRFPWDKTQQWKYTYGWHGSTNLALDFAPVNVTPLNMWILASANGTVTLVCGDGYQAAINLSTPNGVMTYRHIDYNSFISQNINNSIVNQGKQLALLYNGTQGQGYYDTSQNYPWPSCTQGSSPSCKYIKYNTYCGAGTGAHVHWTLPSKPFTVDGWQVDSNALWTKSGSPNKPLYSLFDSTNSSSLVPSTFEDVPSDHPYWQDIEILYANGLTAGCSATPLLFCPEQIMSRAESGVFILRGNFGTSYVPLVAPWDTFSDDWSSGAWAEKWAEGMYVSGLTAGCTSSPLRFCPWDLTPREQAAVFGLKLKYGNAYVPTSASGTVFADMTDPNYWSTKWAEQAYADGLLPNCGIDIPSGKPLFCPNSLVSRGLGAYMIVQAKNLSMP